MSKTVKILFSGDFCPVNRSVNLISKSSVYEAFNNLLPLFMESDIAVTNLECPLTDSTNPILKTGPHLKTSLHASWFLKEAGFSLVTLANNHIMDFGVEGLKSTTNACSEVRLNYTGVGNNLSEARLAYHQELAGYKLAFINICENEWSTTFGDNPGANPLNPITNYYDIVEAKKIADFVFIIFHGGNELYSLPSPRMKELCHFFVNAGADAVICHHSHYLSGYETYNGGLIFYGLGNLLFDDPFYCKQEWNYGLVIQILISGGAISFNVIPITQSNELVGARLAHGNERELIFSSINELNGKISDDRAIEEEFRAFCNRRGTSLVYRSYLQPYSNKYLIAIFKRGILPSLISKEKMRLYHNLIRCESHRDVLSQILKS